MDDQAPALPKKNAFKNSKLTITARHPTIQGVRSTLAWEFFRNNPAVVVRTGAPDEQNKQAQFGQIKAALDVPNFYAFLEFLNKCASSPSEASYTIKCNGHDFEGGQRSKEITHQSDLTVGRDVEGYVYIMVVDKDPTRPKIKFIVSQSDQRYHTLQKGDGTPFTKQEASTVYSKVYYNLLSSLLPNIMVNDYYEAPPWNGARGNTGKPAYSNRQQSNAGSNQQYRAPQKQMASESADDDIPF